jgi:hypothetical protein
MSLLQKYLAGWAFRSNYPSFEAGDEVELFVTGREDGAQIARVGDSKLRLDEDAPDGLLDKRVRLKVTSFDDDAHVGDAEYLETVGTSAF